MIKKRRARPRDPGRGPAHYPREPIPPPPLLSTFPLEYKRYGVPPDRVEKSLAALCPPDVVIVCCMMTYWYPGAFAAIQLARRLFPKALVILGGIYGNLCREHALRHAGADAVPVGPHWFDVLQQILRFAGETGSGLSGNQASWIEPDYAWIEHQRVFPVLTTTGCPCHCTYCATHSLWPDVVRYPRDAILDSLDRLVHAYRATDIVFYDDALLTKQEQHLWPILEEVIRRGWSLRFHTPNALHVRQIGRETAHLLKRAGFVTVRLGLETIERDWQKKTGAKVYTGEYLEALRWLRAAGFSPREIGTYLIVGMPGQSLAPVEDACRLVWEAGSEVKLAKFSPLPHTPMFETWGEAFHFDHRVDPLLQNDSLTPWRSKSFTAEAYQELRRCVDDENIRLRHASPNPVQWA